MLSKTVYMQKCKVNSSTQFTSLAISAPNKWAHSTAQHWVNVYSGWLWSCLLSHGALRLMSFKWTSTIS